MVPMGANSDEWVASVSSYIRSGFGTADWLITPADVAKARADSADRKSSWTVAGSKRRSRALVADASWKASASRNAAAAGGGLNFSGWSSDAPQPPAWYSARAARGVALVEIQFESPARGAAEAARHPPIPTPAATRCRSRLTGSGGAPRSPGAAAALTDGDRLRAGACKFIRVSLTETAADAPAWSMRNIRLFEAPSENASPLAAHLPGFLLLATLAVLGIWQFNERQEGPVTDPRVRPRSVIPSPSSCSFSWSRRIGRGPKSARLSEIFFVTSYLRPFV